MTLHSRRMLRYKLIAGKISSIACGRIHGSADPHIFANSRIAISCVFRAYLARCDRRSFDWKWRHVYQWWTLLLLSQYNSVSILLHMQELKFLANLLNELVENWKKIPYENDVTWVWNVGIKCAKMLKLMKMYKSISPELFTPLKTLKK